MWGLTIEQFTSTEPIKPDNHIHSQLKLIMIFIGCCCIPRLCMQVEGDYSFCVLEGGCYGVAGEWARVEHETASSALIG